MARFAPFLTVKHIFLFLLAIFFLYLIWSSLHNIREGVTSAPNNDYNTAQGDITTLTTELATETNDYNKAQGDITTLTGNLATETNDYNKAQGDITTLTGNLATETNDYNKEVAENAALTKTVQEKTTRLLSEMEKNREIQKDLTIQRLNNKKLIAKLKAKDVELDAFEKHIIALQNASYENKVNNALTGSINFPKQVVNQ